MSETLASRKDALAHPLLSSEDEASLAKRVEAGLYAAHLLATGGVGDLATREELEWLAADGAAAREEFISSNLRLAVSTARKFRNRGFGDDDLVHDAYAGLIKAVDLFDYRKGFKFSTYAVWWIREALHSGIREAAFLKYPEVLFNNMIKVRAVKLRLADELGRTPTLAEVAEAAEMKERDVARCLRVDQPVSSLHAPVADDLTFGDMICDPDAEDTLNAVEDLVDRDRLARMVSRYLDGMPEADANILRARFGLDGRAPRTLREVAEEFGCSRQKVRAREQAILFRLRQPEVLAEFETFLLAH